MSSTGMARYQFRSNRKASGGRYNKLSDKKKALLGRAPAMTKVGEVKMTKIRTLGGRFKLRLLHSTAINLLDSKTRKIKKETIKRVEYNPASRHYARMNVITKGAIVEVEGGFARVTNSPGQEGIINGVKVEYTPKK